MLYFSSLCDVGIVFSNFSLYIDAYFFAQFYLCKIFSSGDLSKPLCEGVIDSRGGGGDSSVKKGGAARRLS